MRETKHAGLTVELKTRAEVIGGRDFQTLVKQRGQLVRDPIVDGWPVQR